MKWVTTKYLVDDVIESSDLHPWAARDLVNDLLSDDVTEYDDM